jgi:hypothetical protein
MDKRTGVFFSFGDGDEAGNILCDRGRVCLASTTLPLLGRLHACA